MLSSTVQWSFKEFLWADNLNTFYWHFFTINFLWSIHALSPISIKLNFCLLFEFVRITSDNRFAWNTMKEYRNEEWKRSENDSLIIGKVEKSKFLKRFRRWDTFSRAFTLNHLTPWEHLKSTEQQEKIIRVFVVDTKTKACSAISEALACLLFCIARCQTQTRVAVERRVLTGYLRKLIEKWKSLVFTQNIFWIKRHHYLVRKFIEFVLHEQVSRNPKAYRATFIIFKSISPFYLAP